MKLLNTIGNKKKKKSKSTIVNKKKISCYESEKEEEEIKNLKRNVSYEKQSLNAKMFFFSIFFSLSQIENCVDK